jgi:hypothetical protein
VNQGETESGGTHFVIIIYGAFMVIVNLIRGDKLTVTIISVTCYTGSHVTQPSLISTPLIYGD